MKRGAAPVKRTREQRMRKLLADARAYLYADDVAAGDAHEPDVARTPQAAHPHRSHARRRRKLVIAISPA